MIERRLLLPAVLLLGLALAAPAVVPAVAAATSPEGASRHIEVLGKKAIATLQRSDVPLAKREADFAAILREGFDLDLIGRFVMGKYWRSATTEQRAQYLKLFRNFVTLTYAIRLGGYGGDSFAIVKTSPIGEGDILVTTRIDRASGPALVAGWRVRQMKESHKIVDVVVEGISMAATQRQEFRSVLQRNGIDGLLEILQARTQKLAASS